MSEADNKFYDRADAHIDLANSQIGDVGSGKVSASMMYATARFNAWLSARGSDSAAEMGERRQEYIQYFLDEYKKMLEENMDDYIQNFDAYGKKPD